MQASPYLAVVTLEAAAFSCVDGWRRLRDVFALEIQEILHKKL